MCSSSLIGYYTYGADPSFLELSYVDLSSPIGQNMCSSSLIGYYCTLTVLIHLFLSWVWWVWSWSGSWSMSGGRRCPPGCHGFPPPGSWENVFLKAGWGYVEITSWPFRNWSGLLTLFKVAVSRDCLAFFSCELNPPGPLINRLKWFCWKICFSEKNWLRAVLVSAEFLI